jgi:class 3 adenylate cyclase
MSVTRYARSDGAHLAFATFGDGPLDILHFTSMIISIDAIDDEPHLARVRRRLSSFARVIEMDPRGIGLSDPIGGNEPLTVETAARDALAVLDAAGAESVAVLAPAGAGPIAIELATMAPDRISAIVFVNAYARLLWAEDYPMGYPEELIEGFLRDNPDPDVEWSNQGDDDITLMAPSLRNDSRFIAWLQRESHRAASPAAARLYLATNILADVRPLLSGITVPTLVLHRQHNRFLPVAHGRYLAAHIPGATLIELPGADHMMFSGDADTLLDEIEEFLTGRRQGTADRVLTTVLFTDIVDSTRRVSELGDAAWRAQLDHHDAAVRGQIARFGGREVNTTGDGFVATFDSPTQAVRCGQAIVAPALALPVRVGIHTGECERRGNDLAGVAVHIAARVAGLAADAQVLVSRTVCDLVSGSALQFEDAGDHELKGVPGRWQLFAVKP